MKPDPIRRLFPVTRYHVYVNHASNGPISLPARRALEADLKLFSRQADYDLPEYFRRLDQARAMAAGFIGADPEEIAFTSSTSYGVYIALCSLPLETTDQVVVMDEVFPTVRCCVDQNLSNTRQVYVKFGGRDPIEAVRPHLTKRTRAVVVDWINYFTGEVLDLDRLGKFLAGRSIRFVVDAMQGLGCLQLDVGKTPMDFMAVGGNKWLFSGQGTGFLYVNRKVFKTLRFAPTGWLSRQWLNFENFHRLPPLYRDARRFEMGTRNALGAHALAVNIGILRKYGLDRVEAKVGSIVTKLRRGLSDLGYEILTPTAVRMSGIITARPPENTAAVYRRLTEQGVILSLRNNALRFSPHFYNNEADVEKILRIIKDSM